MKNPFAYFRTKREIRKAEKELAKERKKTRKVARDEFIAQQERRKEKLAQDIEEQLAKIDLMKQEEQAIKTEQDNLQSQDKKVVADALLRIHAINSEQVGVKQFRLDKIRKQKIIVELKDGERSKEVSAKINGHYLEWGRGKKKQHSVIVTHPENFERVSIPHFSVKRGIKYTQIVGQPNTHDPYAVMFNLTHVQMIDKVVKAAYETGLIENTVRSSKSPDRKKDMMYLLLIGFMSFLIFYAGNGGNL